MEDSKPWVTEPEAKSFGCTYRVYVWLQFISPGQIMQNIHKEMVGHNFHVHQSALGLFGRSSQASATQA